MTENIASTKEIGIVKTVAILTLSLLSASIFISIFRLMPDFIATFSSFEGNLPLPTKIVLKLYLLYPVIAFAVLTPLAITFIKRIHLPKRKLMLPLACFLFLGSIIYFIFMFWAVYLPVFELGAPVK